jgi:low temperature requirement protein LtrA
MRRASASTNGRSSFSLSARFMIAGLIALAAGSAFVINHPAGEATLAVPLMLWGGPVVFLLARGCYQGRVSAATRGPQPMTIAALTGTVAVV